MTRATQYDYIIVGAESAECVLANKLAEAHNRRYSILVAEAGPPDHNLMIHIPVGCVLCMATLQAQLELPG